MWEYKSVKMPNYSDTKTFDAYFSNFSRQGWELHSLVNAFDTRSQSDAITPDGYIAIFKRLKSEPDAIQP